MAAHKFLKNNAGVVTEESTIVTSTGVADEGKIPALGATGVLDASIVNSIASSTGATDADKVVRTKADGTIDETFMPPGIGADISVVLTSEALADGDLVNIYNNAGTANARKADASTAGKEANGFVLESVSSGTNASVHARGTNSHVTGLTPGRQFLSTTPGLCTSTPPSGASQAIQIVGFAISATSMDFQYNPPFILAA